MIPSPLLPQSIEAPRTLRQHHGISAEGVIIACAAGFPTVAVVAALWQICTQAGFPSGVFLPLATLSAFFCTLTTCLCAHLFVDSGSRRTAIFVELVVGLSLVWGGFSYAVFQGSPFHPAINYPGSITERTSGPLSIDGDSHVARTVRDQKQGESAVSSAAYLLIAFYSTFFFVPIMLSWAQRHLSATSRFQILLCMTCLSWLIVGVSLSRNATGDMVPQSNKSDSQRRATPLEGTEQKDLSNSTVDQIPTAVRIDGSFATLALVALFGVPLFLSIPFIQLFLAEFVDTSRLARLWIITTVASLSVLVLMALVAPRLIEQNTIWLSTVGVTLSVLSIWILLPTVSDTSASWTAVHVSGLSWMIGGYVILGRPWQMSSDHLLQSLVTVSLPILMTLLHLLLGLYSPRKLLIFEHLCWWWIKAAILALASAIYWQPALAAILFSTLIYSVVLAVPFSTQPPEISYLRYLFARYLSFHELWGYLWGMFRRKSPDQGSGPDWIDSVPRPVSIDAKVVAALPASQAVRYAVHVQRPSWLDPVTLAVVIVTTIVIAVVYGFWRSTPEATIRQLLPGITTGVAFLLLTAWLLLIRLHAAKQMLLLCKDFACWWNGESMDWLMSYEAMHDIRVWKQRLILSEIGGQSVIIRSLEASEFWPTANFIQNQSLNARMTSISSQLAQSGKVACGPIVLSWSGLSCRGRVLAWEDVGNLTWSSDGVIISKKNGLSNWAFVSAQQIPNPLCLRALMLYFHAVQIFLCSVSAGRTTNPIDFERVLRSVRGMDEFHLSDNDKVGTAMTEVARYQYPLLLSLKADPTLLGLPQAADAAESILGTAWKSLAASVEKFIPLPPRLEYLSQDATDVPASGFAEWVKQQRPLNSSPANLTDDTLDSTFPT